MKVLVAALADYANVAQGNKLNVCGIFDQIHARTFPARHPMLTIAIRLQFEFEDARSQKHTLSLALQDADGRVLFGATGEIQPPPLKAGDRPVVNNIFVLQDLVFQRPGVYSVLITWDSEEMQRIPLEVTQIPASGSE